MIKILRRVSEYTLDEFKQYCKNNGLDINSYMDLSNYWAIEAHEVDLQRFIRLSDPSTVITVSGTVCLDQKYYKVKEKTLSLQKAFSAMITPDAQDYCIMLSLQGKYYVVVTHDRGRNIFKFSFKNDKN